MAAAKPFDYIIVGAGSAGCVIANRLSADPDCRVLLIEAGGWDRNPWLRLPVGYFRTIYDQRFTWQFETEPSEGTNGRAVVWPRGRVVGGSSSINGLIYIRGQHEDFDDWERLGARGWSFRDVLPYFRRMERYPGPPSQWRGASGPLPVSDLRNENPACDAWVAAAQEWGLPHNEDFNGASTFGVGRYQLSLGTRFRASAARAYLHPVLSRRNLTVMTRTAAHRIVVERGRAVGIAWARGTERGTAHAEREIILSAGAIQSPHLLQLSGIGPADVLARAGLRVIVDRREVGAHLQDHYQARTIVRLRERVSLNDSVRSPVGLARMAFDWFLRGRGPLTVGAGQVGGAACTKYAADGRPDIQFNVMPLSVDKPGTPLHAYSGFTAAVWQCHPRSRGRIATVSDDPTRPPKIDANYLADPHDRRVLVEGIKILREIYAQPAFRNQWVDEVLPGPEATSDEALLDFARGHGGTVFHCVGTCRMGDDPDSVIDPNLNVRGMDGLRVADASIMPMITSANTNATAIMIGERAAELIAAAP